MVLNEQERLNQLKNKAFEMKIANLEVEKMLLVEENKKLHLRLKNATAMPFKLIVFLVVTIVVLVCTGTMM
jgi:hypothetical protein